MINEINVRTNKSEYNPGEDICGAIYLRIINPTAGRGIRISFCGYEKVKYEYKNEGREDQFVGYDACNPYIQQDVVLHESQGPLTIGNRIYPFKINLPLEIPGTFKANGETDDIKWSAIVEYVLEIQVINAIEMTIKTVIKIDQSLPRHISGDFLPQGVSAQFEQTKFLVFTDRINTTARLQSHIHRTGENMQLRVIITNNSSITVQSLHIQLLRRLILMCRRRTLSESQNDDNVSGTDDRVFVCPEEGENVRDIEQTIDMTNYQRGLDNIQIPLRHTDGTCIIPAVRGLHVKNYFRQRECVSDGISFYEECVKCEYKLKVVVTLSNLRSYDMTIPVAVIQAEKNHQWSRWRPPEWLAHDDYDIIKSDSIFGVPDGLLHTESFSTIPGFQPL